MSVSGPESRPRALGRASLLLAGVNAAVVAGVVVWVAVVTQGGGGGDPPGPQLANAGRVMPVAAAGLAAVLVVATAGGVTAAAGLIASHRSPGRPAHRSNLIGLALHLAPLAAVAAAWLAVR